MGAGEPAAAREVLFLELLVSSVLAQGVLAALLGLLVGSFLNVVILRLPVMMQRDWRAQCQDVVGLQPLEQPPHEPFNLVRPRSRCPSCGHLIRAHENIPVLSYILLRGRCSACDTRISIRYPVVEALAAVMAVAVALRFGFTVQCAFALLLTWGLIALTFIDIDQQLLPDSITLPLLWLGLGLSVFTVFVDSHTSILGAIAGYLSLWLVYHAFRLLTGKEGMGHGDFKLFALFGAWLGWQVLPLIILLSSVVGALVGIALILTGRAGKSQPLPFGPYLAAAGWVAMMWGDAILHAYLTAVGLG